jgi:hypothetical protein
MEATPLSGSASSRPGESIGSWLAAAGGILLFVSLFLHWYEPGHSAWTVFEVWDLVLAVLAAGTVVDAAARLGWRAGRRQADHWLLGMAAAALLIVIVNLINPPPAATGEGRMLGAWLALVAAGLMLVGALMAVAHLSLAIQVEGRARTSWPAASAGQAQGPADAAAAPASDTSATRPLPLHDPPASAPVNPSSPGLADEA